MRAPAGQAPAALVLFNPAIDLVTPAPWYLRPFARTISPSTLPEGATPPTIIFHGQSDTRVPIATVRSFCRDLRQAGRSCQLREYPGEGHGFYHHVQYSPRLGRSPYADTLARAVSFFHAASISRQPAPRDDRRSR